MSSRLDTWMPLYVGDYLADTGRLSTAQHGAYLLLIMDYWRAGPPPDDDIQLAAVTRQSVREWQKMRPAIERFFQIAEGAWRHKRIDAERDHSRSVSAARRAAGKQGGEQKQSNRVANGVANAKQLGQQKPTQSQLQSHRTEDLRKLINGATRGPCDERGPNFNDAATRKAAWQTRIINEIRRTIPDDRANDLIAAYAAGDPAARAAFERVDKEIKGRRAAA